MSNLAPVPNLEPLYDAVTDSVQLVNKSGDVLAVIPRRMVLRMFRALPVEPPARVAP